MLPIEHRRQEQVRACRGGRLRPDPDLRIGPDVRKSCGDGPDVLVVPGELAAVVPARGDLVAGVAKDRTEPVNHLDVGAESIPDRVHPGLGHIGPYAQDVGEIGDLDNAHGFTPHPAGCPEYGACDNAGYRGSIAGTLTEVNLSLARRS